VVHAETGAVQELCEIARDTPPALLTLPSGDVLLSRDATSRFLGACPHPPWPSSMHAEQMPWCKGGTGQAGLCRDRQDNHASLACCGW